ncbi:MAG: AsmA family protein, partial [Pseudomonadales bacterium]
MCVNSKWLSGHNLLSDAGLWPIARPVRIGLISVAGVAGFLLLSAIVLVVFFDLNAYRRQVQAAASTALGMELSIDGRLGLGFSPGPYLTLSHVQIRNQGEGVASATAANVGIDLMPLVLREIRINRISLKEPVFTIDRDEDGNFNFTNPERPERAFAGLEISEISFTQGIFRYFDQRSELLLEATDCQLDAQHLKLASGNGGHFLKQVSFAAKLDCGE